MCPATFLSVPDLYYHDDNAQVHCAQDAILHPREVCDSTVGESSQLPARAPPPPWPVAQPASGLRHPGGGPPALCGKETKAEHVC